MKINKFYQRFSIRTKMVIAFLSVSIVSVLLLGFSSQYFYSQTVKKDFFNISYEATNRLNYFLDYYFKEFQRSSGTLIDNQTIQGWLVDQNHSNEDITDVQKELQRYVALNFSEIENMFLISPNGEVVSMRQSFSGKENYSLEPWYGLPLTSEMTIMPTHITNYAGSQGERALSIRLPIYQTQSAELIGNLIIDISLSEIRQAFSQSKLGRTGKFFILSDNGTIVYHEQDQWNGLPIEKTGLKNLKVPNDGETTIQMFQGTSYLLAAVTSANTHWRIVSLVPFHEMAGGLRSATYSTFIVLGLISILIIWMVPILTARFVKPVLVLEKLMSKVAKGDLTVRSESVPGQDEFQKLNRSFNIMVKRLHDLFQTNINLRLKEVKAQLQQKEMMIKALQNQINPHLLYNSLGIIQSMAYMEEVPIIEQMAGNLADVYRYTARFNGMETTLREEVVHLQKYLEIIHIRFSTDFQSHIYVNEKFMSCPVVKLILQPFAENAVKYAIEPMEGKGAILVNAYNDKEALVIEIADNGPGIAEDKLEELNERLSKITSTESLNDSRSESLGITNVHARLVLRYGRDYGVRIDSFPGRGTVVSLRIPLIHQD